MTADNLERILRQTLEDFRISRGEKRVLRSILDALDADANDLARIRHQVFRIAHEEVVSPDAEAVLDWLEDVVKILQPRQKQGPRPSDRACFSPGDACARAIIGQLQAARESVAICVFTITDNRLADAILQAHDRGVSVRIVTDNDKATDPGSDIDRLRRHGVAVRVDHSSDHMHHKFAVFDSGCLLTGSYNWTRSASEANEENLVVLHDRSLVRKFVERFDLLWERFA